MRLARPHDAAPGRPRGAAGRGCTPRTSSSRPCAPGPALVLAGGSNVVIADEGVPGTVVLVRTRGIDRRRRRCWSSRPASRGTTSSRAASREGLQGFECLSGIPGSTGATPIQNVGAYGQDVSETVEWVRVYDRETDRVETLDAAACGFDYRRSVFKYRDRWTVLAVAFRLRAVGVVRPAALRGARAGARRAGRRARAAGGRAGGGAGLRRGKGMVIDPGDPDSVSAGSFFTNPILTARRVGRAPRRAAGLPGARRADQDLGGVADRARRASRAGTETDAPGSRPSTRSRSSTAATRRPPS